jgi:hypothetical protein
MSRSVGVLEIGAAKRGLDVLELRTEIEYLKKFKIV